MDDEMVAEIKSEELLMKSEVKDELVDDVKSEHPAGEVTAIHSLADLGPYIQQQDNSVDFVYFADVPKVCIDEPCMLGVDEAGRGPVLGPMVYGIAFCPLNSVDVLKKLGCADSKQLTEEKRESIFNDLTTQDWAKDVVGWAVDVISPNTISTSMFRRAKRSLNEVSMDSAIALIRKAIEMGVNIAEVYVDTVGPPEKYEAKLSALFPDFKITVAKKADSTYPVVSAASICAKVSRDHALKVWQFREGEAYKGEVQFGSGYPGDPATKAFLRQYSDNVFGYTKLVRFSWSTADRELEDLSIAMTFEDDDVEAAKENKKRAKITKFFDSDKPNTPRTRHVFFRDRCLQTVVDL